MIKSILKGVMIGIANIVPGVSGGTLAVSLGIYDKFIHAVTHIRSEFKQSIRLLLPVVIGAMVGILAVARLVVALFEWLPFQTNLFFIGLILGGLPTMWNRVRDYRLRPQYLIAIVASFAVVVGLASLHSHEDGAAVSLAGSFMASLMLFFVGLISAATMVIPGVSGSVILMIMGYYTPILNQVNEIVSDVLAFDIPALIVHSIDLAPFGFGVLIGIVAIAKALEFVFRRFPLLSVWTVMGLIVASPMAIMMMNHFEDLAVFTVLTGVVAMFVGALATMKLGEE